MQTRHMGSCLLHCGRKALQALKTGCSRSPRLTRHTLLRLTLLLLGNVQPQFEQLNLIIQVGQLSMGFHGLQGNAQHFNRGLNFAVGATGGGLGAPHSAGGLRSHFSRRSLHPPTSALCWLAARNMVFSRARAWTTERTPFQRRASAAAVQAQRDENEAAIIIRELNSLKSKGSGGRKGLANSRQGNRGGLDSVGPARRREQRTWHTALGILCGPRLHQPRLRLLKALAELLALLQQQGLAGQQLLLAGTVGAAGRREGHEGRNRGSNLGGAARG